MARCILRSEKWVDIPETLTVPELMNTNISNTPDDKVIYEEAFTGKTSTYGHFKRDVRRAAFWLQNTVGLRQGQIVSIVAPSCIDYILTVHATWWAGGVVSMINFSLHEREIADAIGVVKPDFLVVHDSAYDKISRALSLVGGSHKHSLKLFTLGKPHTEWPTCFLDLHVSGGELDPFSLRGRSTREALCTIVLSSGTTGRPKGVMISHYNLVSVMYQLRGDNPDNWRGDQREIFFPPLSHVYALYVCMTGVFWLGAYVCLMPRFELESYCRLMQDRKATLARIVPPVAKMLAESPVVRKYKYPSLEYFSCSAAPLKLEVAKKLREAFPGVALCQTYGATELSGPCVQSGTRDRSLHITAAGTPITNMEIKFLPPDLEGAATSARGPGEIIVRGPNVMMGYKDNPEATANAIMKGGWYRTGDLGYIDENGYLVCYDRLKDIIKYNGFQVSPLEVEEVLHQHPLVDEASVCGVWNESGTTELVRAYIVLRTAADEQRAVKVNIAKEDIMQHVAERLSHYKHLSGGVVFLDQLPKSANGKVLRRVLREYAEKEQGAIPRARL